MQSVEQQNVRELSRRVSSGVPPRFHQQAWNGGRRADESFFWLTSVWRPGMNDTADQRDLLAEGRELLAIFIQSAKTASDNNRQ